MDAVAAQAAAQGMPAGPGTPTSSRTPSTARPNGSYSQMSQQHQYQHLHHRNGNTPPPGMHSHNLDLSAPQASSLLSAAGPPPTSEPAIPAGTGPGGTPTTALSVYHLITQLCQRPEPSDSSAAQDGSEARRETALFELSKKREQYEDLALVLWHSFGVMSSLLQEITSVYPLLSPPALTAHASNRVCNALALLQCVASHHETRGLFLQGKLSSNGINVKESAIPDIVLAAQPTFPSFCTPSSTRRPRRDRSSTSD